MARKLQLGYKEIEARLAALKGHDTDAAEVGYEILHAFGKSEREISRFKERKGVLKSFDGLLTKGEFCYRPSSTERLAETLEQLKQDPQVLKAQPKIVCTSDGLTVLAYDLRERETYENPIDRMYCDFAFFYPLMGVERVHYVEESPADVKAAEKLARLHDELRAYNSFDSDDDLHDLNIFITRLLFCFFAEDTGIFAPKLFSSSVERFTRPDGSDLADYLDRAFNIMDVRLRPDDAPTIITQFPYVNGGLFSKHIRIPRMGQKARKLILECGELDWKDINPDIFGSMIQAVVNPDIRAKEGMHYTSVPNIMKVINPLFLDELRAEYNQLNETYVRQRALLDMGGTTQRAFVESCKPVIRKCNALLLRMSRMKFFDPACGSGNFLIITYKSLRLLEMEILHLVDHCNLDQRTLEFASGSHISLSQFYGIELLDFPHEVAMLSLWLAEHQMDNKFFENFGINTQALPLHNITQIYCGNACRMDWNTVCPHGKGDEVFVFGNPPYLGSAWQDASQKEDMSVVFNKFTSYKNLDYIACWFYLGANYILNSKAKCAFVSTNSICQGEQVSLLWNQILSENLKIFFAHKSFKWSNNAKYNAGVYCVIVGLSTQQKEVTKLYENDRFNIVHHINGYLMDAPDISIGRSSAPISKFPPICKGSMARDDGNLLLDDYERSLLISQHPSLSNIIKPFIGAAEYLRGINRYCLWLDESKYNEIKGKFTELDKRFQRVAEFRAKSEAPSTRAYAERPYLFVQRTYKEENFIYIPQVSSQRREYVPIGFFEKGTVTSDKAFSIYCDDVSILGILSSKMHMIWFKTFGGRLKLDYSYSSNMCYNSFPFPSISPDRRAEIEKAAEDILIARAGYPALTLAELYDPDRMPDNLRQAHARMDDLVERCYPGYPFATDEARLECLFRMYEEMNKKTDI